MAGEAPKKTTPKSRNFCFTMYNVDTEKSPVLGKLVENGFARTLFFTHELGDKGDNPHIQAYIVTRTPVRVSNVKDKINKLFDEPPNPHIEIAKGTAVDNLRYVRKEMGSGEARVHHFFGENILPPGKKRDDSKFESYVELLERGEINTREIEERDRAHYARHAPYYERVVSGLKRKELTPPPFVAWFSGETGTGKTFTAQLIAKRLGFEVYEASVDNGFFSVYRQEELCLWDDYRSGPIPFNKLLKFVGRDGDMLNIKGGEVFFKPKVIIFTSPEGVVSAKTTQMKERNGRDNNFAQLERRVDYTCEFTSNAYNAIPCLEEVERNSIEVTEEFLGVFKQHLISTGFQNIIDAIPCIKDVTPLEVQRLVRLDSRVKLTKKSNVNKGEINEEIEISFKPIYIPPVNKP